MPDSFVEHVHCETADEFLDALSPRGRYLRRYAAKRGESTPRDLIFRGHSDDSYRLIPSGFRPGNLKKWSVWKGDTNGAQIQAEIETLRSFFWMADANGLSLPEDSQALRGRLDYLSSPAFQTDLRQGTETWPPDDVLSLIGLAQHYGLPTRLLDWSRSELVAAYFAADGAASRLSGGYQVKLMPSVGDVSDIPTRGTNLLVVADVAGVLYIRIFNGCGREVVAAQSLTPEQARQIEALRVQLDRLWPPHELSPSERVGVIAAVTSIVGHSPKGYQGAAANLAVWALSQRAMKLDAIVGILFGERPLKLVTAPTATNPNLRAQQGLFSIFRPQKVTGLDQAVDARPLDELLESTHIFKNSNFPTLFHFTLPSRESFKLLWLLEKKRVPGRKGCQEPFLDRDGASW